VVIEMTEEAGKILIFVDAPWRRSDGCMNYRGWEYYGYDVDIDFELRVPSRSDLFLKTVNNGRMSITGVEGSFDVRNVNGDVRMTDIAGSGKAATVNGDVTVTFLKNPSERSSFSTVNGEVDIRFAEGLSADLRLKTFNGEVFSDFPMKDITAPPVPVRENHAGRKVYRSGDSFTVRVGQGGPEMSFDTLNGNIYIVRNKE